MISYERFRQEVMNRIKSYLPESYAGWKVRTETEYKVNQTLECLMLISPEKSKLTAVPRLYLQDCYNMFLRGASADFILRMIASRIQNGSSAETAEQSGFDFLRFQEDVVLQLVHRFRNHVFLKSVPHGQFQDLAVICRIMGADANRKRTSAIVDYSMLQAMGITEEELFERAYKRTPQLLPFRLINSCEMLPCKGIFREECEEDCRELCSRTGNEPQKEMLMLTNDSETYGAAAMLYPEQLNRACEMLGGNILILPGSMHELYIVREESEKVELYRQLVAYANREVVDEKEWLSEQVYRYHPKTGKVRVVV